MSDATLPDGIRSRFVEGVNGLTMHILEAGHEGGERPCLLLLHGFPELAYSWRKVMLPLAQAGYHVVAPDQRGYGRTTGWDGDYDGDIADFRLLNLVRDAQGLLAALGHPRAHLVGHDFGSPVAAWCALMHPEMFRSVVLMSAPFAGPPPATLPPAASDVHADLAALAAPRKHYQWYYSTREADADMRDCSQGINDFLRAYYHHKSADWAGNRPHALAEWSAAELAKLPTYYVMELGKTMAETVAPEMPEGACAWLSDDELGVYASAFARTGFQGGLNWYRCVTGGAFTAEMRRFADHSIDVPSCFIAGKSDWGVYQKPGDFERMRSHACSNMLGCHLVDGAGHWVQQEQPEAVSDLLVDFLRRVG